jgi:hypothetical protein
VKTITTGVTTPTWWKAPNTLKWPTRPKSGAATGSCGTFGTVSPQAAEVMSASALTSTATTVVATMPMSSAPLTRRASSAMVNSTPMQKTSTGHPVSCPSEPSCTGVDPSHPGCG